GWRRKRWSASTWPWARTAATAERSWHELAAAFLRRTDGALGIARAPGHLVAAQAYPAQAAGGSISPAEDPRRGASPRGDTAAKPVVADAAAAPPGRSRHCCARRARLEPPRA